MSDELGATTGTPTKVEFTCEGKLAILRLDRPRARNALDGSTIDGIEAGLDTFERNPGLRVVILTGSNECFSAGADLKEKLADPAERVARMHRLVGRLANFPVPTIAAIEGWALGGGLELAMACTFRAAAPGARLGLPEVHLGVIPSYGGTQLAPRILGAGKALELLCFGDPVSAEEALAIGLVNWLAPSPGGALALAVERAALLALRNPAAVRAARAAVRGGLQLNLLDALEVERAAIAQLLAEMPQSDPSAAFGARHNKPD